MIIHDMEGQIEIGDTFKNPKFRKGNRLQTFDRVVANPMWNQDWCKEDDYDADELDRFPKGAGFPGRKADWGWAQHHPRLAERRRPGRDRARHRRRLARLRQRQQEQGKRRAPMVRRAGPDRRRDLPARKSVLQHHRAGHHAVPEQGQAEGPQGQAFPAQRQPASSTKATRRTIISDDAIAANRRDVQSVAGRGEIRRIVTREEIAKKDYNISPSRYIHTGEADEYRPIAEIVEELDELEEEASEVSAALRRILHSLHAS